MSTERKQAAILLRVSSRGQVETDYDPEGLSLPAQRAECERKAAAVGAHPVLEYVEPRVSGGFLVKRKVFRQMIADIRERGDIDYVIVWSVSRWARNQEDHWTARGLINRAGAKLISVKEPIGEDTSHGVMLEGVMAAVAASRRIEIAEDVKQGVRRKVEVGGFPGYAPLGYLNVREPLPHGGEVRTIHIDRARVEIILWGFETYATGLYSINDMVTLLAARGLRTRGNRRYASKRLNHSTLHALLSNPFYTGKFLYNGKLYQGRHEAIISEELFDRVQTILKAHNLSGERDRKHAHYLKGTIFCEDCGHRLIYSRNTGNGGTYAYFVCPDSQRRGCTGGYHRMEEVEAKIEEHYKTIALSPESRERIAAHIERHFAKQAATSAKELGRCEALLADLKVQERKLLAKDYKNEVSEELYSEEATRMKRERLDAEAIMARLTIRHETLSEFLALVLKLATCDLHFLYLCAKPYTRRLMNQAIFEAIWIDHDDQIRSQLASPFKEILEIDAALAAAIQNVKAKKAINPDDRIPVNIGGGENDEAPDPWEESEDFALGSISPSMVGPPGLEPGTYRL